MRLRQEGKFFRDALQGRLGAGDDPGNVFRQLGDLGDEKRHQGDQQKSQEKHEQSEDKDDGRPPGTAESLQVPDQPLQQKGDDHAGDDRCEQVADAEHNGRADTQHQKQDDHLFIGEYRAEPLNHHFHREFPSAAWPGFPPCPGTR